MVQLLRSLKLFEIVGCDLATLDAFLEGIRLRQSAHVLHGFVKAVDSNFWCFNLVENRYLRSKLLLSSSECLIQRLGALVFECLLLFGERLLQLFFCERERPVDGFKIIFD